VKKSEKLIESLPNQKQPFNRGNGLFLSEGPNGPVEKKIQIWIPTLGDLEIEKEKKD